jgi:hypothetical protein
MDRTSDFAQRICLGRIDIAFFLHVPLDSVGLNPVLFDAIMILQAVHAVMIPGCDLGRVISSVAFPICFNFFANLEVSFPMLMLQGRAVFRQAGRWKRYICIIAIDHPIPHINAGVWQQRGLCVLRADLLAITVFSGLVLFLMRAPRPVKAMCSAAHMFRSAIHKLFNALWRWLECAARISLFEC